jgi:hypothetical protein
MGTNQIPPSRQQRLVLLSTVPHWIMSSFCDIRHKLDKEQWEALLTEAQELHHQAEDLWKAVITANGDLLQLPGTSTQPLV